ncbi:MAG: sulfite exporter TauE/SafE family protein [Acidobacteriota bacterium]
MIVSTFNLFRFAPTQSVDRKPWLAFVALPIGLEVGFSSAGAGALGSLALMNLTKLSPAAVVGTDLTFGLVLNFVGGGIRAAMGDLDQSVLVRLLAGGVVGAILGSLLAQKLPSKKLKFVLCIALVGLGGNLAWKGASTAMHW